MGRTGNRASSGIGAAIAATLAAKTLCRAVRGGFLTR